MVHYVNEFVRATCSNIVANGKNVSVKPKKWLEVALSREHIRYGGR